MADGLDAALVERVARAMVAAQFNDWNQLDGGDQGYWLEMAKAALTAAATAKDEVTGEQLRAGIDALRASGLRHGAPGEDQAIVLAIYEALHSTPKQER